MIEVKGYYSEFIDSLDNILSKKNVSIVEINIINELFSLIKDPSYYIIPQHIEDYKFSKSNYKAMEINKTAIIETEIESYELMSKNTKIKTFTPTIYICIKEDKKNFENLNLLINAKNKIRDNIILVVRKHNGVWQIPSIGFNIFEDKLNLVEIFTTKYFEFQQSQKQINIQECINIILKKTNYLHKNNVYIINDKQIDLVFYQKKEIDYQIPTFLFMKKDKIDLNVQMMRIEEDNLYKGALDDLYYFGIRL